MIVIARQLVLDSIAEILERKEINSDRCCEDSAASPTLPAATSSAVAL
jgi:hypothetical protein